MTRQEVELYEAIAESKSELRELERITNAVEANEMHQQINIALQAILKRQSRLEHMVLGLLDQAERSEVLTRYAKTK